MSGTLPSVASTREWRVRPPLPRQARSALSAYPDLLAQFLYNRGIRDAAHAERFLSRQSVTHDPLLLPDMEQAIERITRAIQRKEHLAIFGDFDVDGISATALLARALSGLGATVTPYIPHRVAEGHGLSLHAVHSLADQGVTLLITVDCGITSNSEIEAATRHGVDTIVTDHHLAPQGAAPAYAVVGHQLPDSRYPFPHLTGAGLALKLAQALYQPGYHGWPPDLFTLAALGTIADVAPLHDENRSIVQQGLEDLGSAPSPGLRSLIRSAGLQSDRIDSEEIAWALAPRLNAPGRLDDAMISYRLLVEDSEEQAVSLAGALEHWNQERQRLTKEATEKAKALAEEELSRGAGAIPLLLVADPSFLPGIVGLVASRLAEEFYRPAVVVAVGPEVSRGSCRSIPEFNIGAALYQVASRGVQFNRHGGHHQAAGFTIATGKLQELRQRLTEVAHEGLRDIELRPRWDIDQAVALGSLPRDIYSLIYTLAPFGEGNPVPVFLSRKVQLVQARHMGKNGEHLRLKLRDQGVTWDAVAFRQGNGGRQALTSTGKIDVVYTIGMDRWGPQDTIRLTVLDFRPSGG